MDLGLRELLEILLKRRRLIIGTTVGFLVVGAILTFAVLSPVYEASARIEIMPVHRLYNTDGLVEPFANRFWIQTQMELVGSEVVLSKAADKTGVSSKDLDRKLSVQAVPDTQLVEIKVEAPGPEEAARWTEAVAEAFIEYRRERTTGTVEEATEQLERQIEAVEFQLAEIERIGSEDLESRIEDLQLSEIELRAQMMRLPDAEVLSEDAAIMVTSPRVPESPERPRKLVNLAISIVLGGLVGGGTALLLESLKADQSHPPTDSSVSS